MLNQLVQGGQWYLAFPFRKGSLAKESLIVLLTHPLIYQNMWVTRAKYVVAKIVEFVNSSRYQQSDYVMLVAGNTNYRGRPNTINLLIDAA